MITTPMTDPLREYAQTRSPSAFQRLVTAHVDAVYSQCLRQLRDPAAAEDVTQQVFITLAQKAAKIPAGVILDGWLFTTARYCSNTYQRAAARRRSAESKAATMRNELVDASPARNDFSSQAEPILDDALADLNPRDRDALLLRFFQGQTLREVGASLGVSEDAAKQRVSRAVEKLRNYFARRGVTAPATTIAAFLTSAIKPASPKVAHAALQAATLHSAAASHGVGLLSKGIWSLPKIAASFTLAGALAAGAIVAAHAASAQTPPAAPVPAPSDAAANNSLPNSPSPDFAATQPFAQSTPLGAFNKLVSAMEAGDQPAIEECLCNDGKDPGAAALARAFVLDAASVYRIEKAWKDKFGSDMKVSGLNFDDFPDGTFITLFQGTANTPGGPEITIDGDLAKMRVPVPAEKFVGTGPDRQTAEGRWSGSMFVFNRIDGNWKLNTDRTFNFIVMLNRVSGNNTDSMVVESQICLGINDTLSDVAEKIETSAITSKGQAAKTVQTEVDKVFRDAKVRGSSIMTLPVIGG
jgi:RNA polymerase sigma factor (sigma-70 family)